MSIGPSARQVTESGFRTLLLLYAIQTMNNYKVRFRTTNSRKSRDGSSSSADACKMPACNALRIVSLYSLVQYSGINFPSWPMGSWYFNPLAWHA